MTRACRVPILAAALVLLALLAIAVPGAPARACVGSLYDRGLLLTACDHAGAAARPLPGRALAQEVTQAFTMSVSTGIPSASTVVARGELCTMLGARRFADLVHMLKQA